MRISFFDRLADAFLSLPAAEKIYSEEVKKGLRILYPAKQINEMCRVYYRNKLSLLLKIFFVGILFISVAIFAQSEAAVPGEGNLLPRGAAGESSRSVALKVQSVENDAQEIVYDVKAQLYTPSEVKELTDRFLTEYESLICGENESLQEVHKDLLLRETYADYPMDFTWESSDYALVSDEGVVGNEELTEEKFVQLTVRITYDATEYEHVFSVRVVPPKLTEAQIWYNEILAAIRAADEEQKYESELHLPEKIGNRQVQYKTAEESSVWILFVLLLVVPVMVYRAKDRDLEKEIDRQKHRMNLKYPEFVSKMQLLLGAGMTVRNTFVRLSEDPALGEDLREELRLLLRDMKNGMSARDALDRFGKRTANPLYIKFSALLIQNMKKGTEDLLSQLSGEASEAFVIRKTNARRLGEEAGTKLLGPMILMLVVVMAVLMIPAFLSFQL